MGNNLDNAAVLKIMELMLNGYMRDYKKAVEYHDVTSQYVNLNQCRNDLDHPMYEAILIMLKLDKKRILKEVGDIEYLCRMQTSNKYNASSNLWTRQETNLRRR